MGITIRKAIQDDAVLINSMASVVFPHLTAIYCRRAAGIYARLDVLGPNILKQMDEGTNIFVGRCRLWDTHRSEEGNRPLPSSETIRYAGSSGQGVGKLLFYGVVDYIKSVHSEHCYMELNVNRKNRAVGFYKKLGMEIDRKGDFHIGNGYYMNDYIMRLAIE